MEAWSGSVALRVNNVAVCLRGFEGVSLRETPPGESLGPESTLPQGKGGRVMCFIIMCGSLSSPESYQV